jgi:hypothetical protein
MWALPICFYLLSPYPLAEVHPRPPLFGATRGEIRKEEPKSALNVKRGAGGENGKENKIQEVQSGDKLSKVIWHEESKYLLSTATGGGGRKMVGRVRRCRVSSFVPYLRAVPLLRVYLNLYLNV